MNKKLLIVISFLFALSISSMSRAEDLSYLSVRHVTASQDYEAVLSLDNTVCLQVSDVSSVQVVGSDILIESQQMDQLPCIFIPPIVAYEKTAFIGSLAPGQYTVVWSQPGAFSFSTSFDASQNLNRIPANSPWALLLLVFGVLVFARFSIRSRKLLTSR